MLNYLGRLVPMQNGAVWRWLAISVAGCCSAYGGYRLAVQQGFATAEQPWAGAGVSEILVGQLAFFAFGTFAAVRRAMRAAADLKRMEAFELAVPFRTASSRDSASYQAREVMQLVESWPAAIARLGVTRRLREILNQIARTDSTYGLTQELRHQSAVDEARHHHGRSWEHLAMGLVVLFGTMGAFQGILTTSAHRLPSRLASSDETLSLVSRSGPLRWGPESRQYALNTCGMLSILIVATFLANRLEDYELSQLDRRTTHLLWDIFGNDRLTNDPQLATLQRIAQTTMSAIDQMSRDQADSWKNAWTQWYDQWNRTLAGHERQWATALDKSVRGSMELHQARFIQFEQASIDRMAKQADEWQQLLQKLSERWEMQQAELTRQSEILVKVLDATGEVQNLEKSLNQNLRALAGAKNFEDTVMSLSAAIQLLSTRLGRNVSPETRVQLQPNVVQERAA